MFVSKEPTHSSRPRHTSDSVLGSVSGVGSRFALGSMLGLSLGSMLGLSLGSMLDSVLGAALGTADLRNLSFLQWNRKYRLRSLLA